MIKALGLSLLAVFLAVLSLLLLVRSYPNTDLLSPSIRSTRPDLTKQLSANLHLLPELDYSQAVPITTLHPQISYLVFSPDTFRVYAAKNEHQATSPASFTKLMTAQVALDLLPLDHQISTTPTSIDRVPTVLGLKIGETLTLEELVRASITTSANDAAATLGEGVATHFSQSPDFFLDLMNQKTALLRMTSTQFRSMDGLDTDGQYSSLVDIAKLVYNALHYQPITEAGQGDRQDLEADGNHGRYYLPNWNGLLGVYPGVTGLKIAYTGDAGYSTIVTADRAGTKVVVILRGADSIMERDLAAAALLDSAYIQHRQAPINLTKSKLKNRYQQGADLATQIKRELKELENNPPQ